MPAQMGTDACPLCGRQLRFARRVAARDIHDVECERCGSFEITRVVLTNGLTLGQKSLLSAYCRRQPEGAAPPVIKPNTIDEFIRALPQYTPAEKLDNLLSLMGRMTPALGEYTTFKPEVDYPLLIAENAAEVYYLRNELQERGYIKGPADSAILTVKGWERLEEIKRSGRQSNRAFVAMWFSKKTNDVYDQAIDPAIRRAGYLPLRIDRHEHVNRIDDEIIGQIKRSRFMVADFTGQRYGVYFEAGMMQGLGRTVIWLCDKQELEEGKLHFDVRQFNFIAYESNLDLAERLYHRILAIEGEGRAVPAEDKSA